MTMQCSPLIAAEMSGEESPFVLEFFMVRGPGFLCMAYCGPDAQWRDAFNHDVLPGDIRVLG